MASLITFCSSSPCSFPQRRPILVPYQRLVLVRTMDLEFLDLQSFFFWLSCIGSYFLIRYSLMWCAPAWRTLNPCWSGSWGGEGQIPVVISGNWVQVATFPLNLRGYIYIYTHIYAFTMEESNFILFPQHDHTVLYIDHSDIVHISAQIPDHLEGKKHPDHMAPQWRPMPQVWRHHLVHWRSGLSKASPRRSAVGCSGMLGYWRVAGLGLGLGHFWGLHLWHCANWHFFCILLQLLGGCKS